MHCAILKASYGFKTKRAHKVKGMQFFLKNAQNEIFKILKMFIYNMKFTGTACSINLKISNKDKNTIIVGHYYGAIIEGL